MVLETISEGIRTGLNNAVQSMMAFLPNIIAAIIILIVGYIVGKIVGGGIRKVLEKAKIGEKLSKSQLINKMLSIINIKFERLIGMLVSFFFYAIFILVAIDILRIQMLREFVTRVILYLPNFIAGILVLIIGLVVVEGIVNFIRGTTKEYKISGANAITAVFRAILMLVVIIITLDQWRINTSIIYTFLQPLAWGVAAAIAIAFGWGFKDIVGEWGKKISSEMNKERKSKK
jgi:hypothetical protein